MTEKKKKNPAVEQKKRLSKSTNIIQKEKKQPISAEYSDLELEENDENEEMQSATNNSTRGESQAAALATANDSHSETSASLKNFRHHPDMENFYRFIYENDLRHEALGIFDQIMNEKEKKKSIKASKTQTH